MLDIGCGDGVLLDGIARRRPGWTLAGLELASAAARIAQARLPDATIRSYDGARLPWPDASFDVGVLSHVLEHVADPASVLREAARVCRLVVVEVPLERNVSAHRPSKRALAESIGHVQRFSRRDVHRLAERAALDLQLELTGTLSRDALRYLADSPAARRRANIKWVVQRVLHRCAPAVAERVFTVQYVVLCRPRPT